jgi:hypothetical protein
MLATNKRDDAICFPKLLGADDYGVIAIQSHGHTVVKETTEVRD